MVNFMKTTQFRQSAPGPHGSEVNKKLHASPMLVYVNSQAKINRTKRFWKASSELVTQLKFGLQILEAYFKTGLRSVTYVRRFDENETSLRLRLR